MPSYILPVILSFFFHLPVSYHPIKMTTGRLQFLAGNNAELIENFFADDLEPVLKKQYKIAVLDLKRDKALAKKLVEDYTRRKLGITIDSRQAALTIKDIAFIENNVLQASFKVDRVPGQKTERITITNQLLFEAYEDQVNIIRIAIPGKDEKLIQFIPFDYKKQASF